MVTYLIDSNINNDPYLRAEIANSCVNIDSMRSDFEAAIAFLLPVDPFVKHKERLNKVSQISKIILKGKSHSHRGVELRWYIPEE